jgi:ABC-type multidrug transport system permease subunit
VGPLLLGISTTANSLDATPVVAVMRNGPTPSDSSWLAPGLIALISTFIAFLAGASSLARESAQGTLHWLVGATQSSWFGVGAAKVTVATMMGALTLLVLILFNWLVLGHAVNQGLSTVLALQLLSLLVAGMQGVAVSALVGRQDQAFLISGAYLVLLSLFSGVFLPIAGAGGAAEFISWLLPTTFSQASLVDWMQHASSAPLGVSSFAALGALLVGSAILWTISMQVLAVRQ